MTHTDAPDNLICNFSKTKSNFALVSPSVILDIIYLPDLHQRKQNTILAYKSSL